MAVPGSRPGGARAPEGGSGPGGGLQARPRADAGGCSCALTDDEVQNEEDLHAAGIAAYIVLLGAHARGLGGYWRTPAVLRDPAGLAAAVGVPKDERFVGLIHLGHAAGDKPAPERPPPDAVVTYLD